MATGGLMQCSISRKHFPETHSLTTPVTSNDQPFTFPGTLRVLPEEMFMNFPLGSLDSAQLTLGKVFRCLHVPEHLQRRGR